MFTFVIAVDVLEHLRALDGVAAIAAMQLVLIAGCVGFPAPEEAVFATAGFLSASGRVPALPAFVACWATLWALDAIFFEIGRRYGRRLRHSSLGSRVPRRRWAWIRRHMARHGAGTVFAARFVMGLRVPTFLLAGASRMPRRRFLAASAVGCLLSGGIPFLLGRLLANALPGLVDTLAAGKWVLFGAVVAAILVFGVARMRKPMRAPLRGRSESANPPR